MSWSRVDHPRKNPKKSRTCKKCYKRQRTIEKNKVKREKVGEVQAVDFGEHPARACLADTSYRLNYIIIGGDHYVGIIKCMDKSNTRTRCFMPLASWHSMINDVLPKMTYPPVGAQLQVDERYHFTHLLFEYEINRADLVEDIRE